MSCCWVARTSALEASGLAIAADVRARSAAALSFSRATLQAELHELDAKVDASRQALAMAEARFTACHGVIDAELAELKLVRRQIASEHAALNEQIGVYALLNENERDRLNAFETREKEIAKVWNSVTAAETEALSMAEALQAMQRELETLNAQLAASPGAHC